MGGTGGPPVSTMGGVVGVRFVSMDAAVVVGAGVTTGGRAVVTGTVGGGTVTGNVARVVGASVTGTEVAGSEEGTVSPTVVGTSVTTSVSVLTG